jgi:tRNA A-37 threonylcarbamoyl transferase component Bud32
MKRIVRINPLFNFLQDFINSIPEDFESLGEIIYTGRNIVRKVEIGEQYYIIKYFKKINPINRFVYAHIRKSKCQRAYEHSEILLKNGIDSPVPIAYIDISDKGIMKHCYYISQYTDYKPIDDLFNMPVAETEDALKDFARFTFKLHKAGIYHGDYNVTNILFKMTPGECKFSLIDTNRMRFRKYNYYRGLHNMNRLYIPINLIGIIAAEYAKLAEIDSIKALNSLTFYRIMYLGRLSAKRRIKKLKHLHF